MNKKLSLMFGMILIVLTLFPLISSAQAPSIITNEPVEVNSDFATLSGEITDLGSEVELNTSFRYKTEDEENWTYTEFKLKDSTGIFHYTIKNLTSATTYEYEFLADYNDNQVKGGILTFETEPSDSLLGVDFEKDSNVTILIIVLAIAVLLFILGQILFSGLIVIISGFILMASQVNIIISAIVILVGFLVIFMKGGNE